MDAPAPLVRRLPLKIAGIIGFLSSAIYLAVILEDGTLLVQAVIWLVIMAAAAGLAWFADQVPARSRRMAIWAAVLFFALGIFSTQFFVLVFLGASLLAFSGFLGMPKSVHEAGSES